ncbi:MAG: EAL domain-containing protein [Pseudomonadota bacterium]
MANILPFSIVALFGLIMTALFLKSRRRVHDLRRLALFPERNPNPAICFARDGRVLYSNPATHRVLAELGENRRSPADLFPPHLIDLLAALPHSPTATIADEHVADGRVFAFSLHLVDDDVVHAYIGDVTARKQAEDQLVHHGYHDPVSGFPNRRMFLENWEESLGRDAGGTAKALLLLRLGRFRRVTDSLGHAVADRLIKGMADRLRGTLECVGDTCRYGRVYSFGGDLFSIFLTNIRSNHLPLILAERLVEDMKQAIRIDDYELFVTLALGIAVSPQDGEDALTLLTKAELALQWVQQHGGNGFRCYDEKMNADAESWLALESELRRALAQGELLLHFQPQFDLATSRITGLEALVRWRHPQKGLVPPEEFIPLAEETGLILELGEWVLRAACRQNQVWLTAGLPPVTIAVNISARQFEDEELAARVSRALEDSGLPPRLLELEITETAAMQSAERAVAVMKQLKSLGIGLGIDDFGTGFSSLRYLQSFPVDRLKIDQSFVRNAATNDQDAAIVKAVIDLGHALKLRLTAEGVDTDAQCELLKTLGCEEVQGYRFGPPLAAENVGALLQDEKTAPPGVR